MPRTCSGCGGLHPNLVWVDGRRRNLQRRRFCLDCSPFGSRNNRNADTRRRDVADVVCVTCGRLQRPAQTKGRECWTCAYTRRGGHRLDCVHAAVGDACWLCGYTRGPAGRRVLDFHHVRPAEKLFSLDRRHLINLAWRRVVAELRKCVLLCANCHREVEAKLVETDAVLAIHRQRWSTITLDPGSAAP